MKYTNTDNFLNTRVYFTFLASCNLKSNDNCANAKYHGILRGRFLGIFVLPWKGYPLNGIGRIIMAGLGTIVITFYPIKILRNAVFS